MVDEFDIEVESRNLADRPLWERIPPRPLTPDEFAALIPETVPNDYLQMWGLLDRENVDEGDELVEWGFGTVILDTLYRYSRLDMYDDDGSRGWNRGESVERGANSVDQAARELYEDDVDDLDDMYLVLLARYNEDRDEYAKVFDVEEHGLNTGMRYLSAPERGSTRRSLFEERIKADEADAEQSSYGDLTIDVSDDDESSRRIHAIEELQTIDGVGFNAAEELYGHGFESIEDLREATQQEIADVPAIGNALAARIKANVGDADEDEDLDVEVDADAVRELTDAVGALTTQEMREYLRDRNE